MQGRGQVVPDQFIESRTSEDLVFYLDGAHTPESMEVCAKWFSSAVKRDNQSESSEHLVNVSSGSSHDQFSGEENCQQVRRRGVSFFFVLDKRFKELRAYGFFADIAVQLHVS